MRPVCRHKLYIRGILACIQLFCLCLGTGCRKSSETRMTLGQWIKEINTAVQIEGHVRQEPYFHHIPEGHMYFDDVQKAVEWGVLSTEYPFDPDAPLTREWTAYTLVHLADTDNDTVNTQIRDLRKSQFPKEISTAAGSGLMKLDRRNMFHPKEEISFRDAEELLDQVVRYMNSREITDPVFQIEWRDDIQKLDEEPLRFDEDTKTAVFSKAVPLYPQEIITWEDGEEAHIYAVEEVKDTGDSQEVTLKEPEIPDLTEEMDLAGSFQIDFTKVEILDTFGSQEEQHSYVYPTGVSLMKYSPAERSYSFHGYTITLDFTSAGITAQVLKTFPSGGQFVTTLDLNNVRPTYQWQMHRAEMEHAYFRIDFQTAEKIELKPADFRRTYGDFRNVTITNFLSALSGLYETHDETAELHIPLCDLRVPVPNAPYMNIPIHLSLNIYATGRMELSLSQNESLGLEIRGGVLRKIAEMDHSCENMLHGDASLMAGLTFGLNLENVRLCDVEAESGVKADVQAQVHLYDNAGNHQVLSSDLPADLLNEAADGNPNVLVCGDLQASWMTDVKLNSSSSLAGKLGLSGNFQLADAQNNDLIPGGMHHVENWHFVPECTRKDRERQSSGSKLLVTDNIAIADYSLILDPGETGTIRIIGLPRGYTISSLVFTSQDGNVASAEGIQVHGKQPGSTMIRIQTQDGKYSINCNILVRQFT